MDRPEIISITPELLAYIEYLEGCLNGSSELIQALNTASKVFADDLNMLCLDDSVDWVADGEQDVPKVKLRFLSGDAKDKTFDRIMVLFTKFNDIKALSLHFKGAAQPQQPARGIKIKPGGNPYEHVVNELKNGCTKL